MKKGLLNPKEKNRKEKNRKKGGFRTDLYVTEAQRKKREKKKKDVVVISFNVLRWQGDILGTTPKTT